MTFPTEAVYPEQSQATTILVLGILGLICCAPLAVAAWIMGNKEMAAIDAGMRNPQNRGTANAGRIIGIIGTALLGVYIVLGIVWLFLGLSFATFSTS